MKFFFVVTTLVETGAGLALMVFPSAVVKLLLGSGLDSLAAQTLGRLAGAALLALGVACGLALGDVASQAARSLIIAMLFYNFSATLLLAFAGLNAKLVGVALWPAVILHLVMTSWCLICLCHKASAKPMGTPRMTHS